MSCEKATKAVFRALTDNNIYPIRSLNRFKMDPRVKVGPRAGVGDDWAIFDFATVLQRSRRRWFVFKARWRFYAVDAESAREARRIIEQYKPIHVVVAATQHQAADSAAGRNLPRPPAPAPQSLDGVIPLRVARSRFLRLLANRRAQLERRPSEHGSRASAARYR